MVGVAGQHGRDLLSGSAHRRCPAAFSSPSRANAGKKTKTPAVSVSVEMSRPSASHAAEQPARRDRRVPAPPPVVRTRPRSSGRAWRATSRSIRGPLPAIRIGGAAGPPWAGQQLRVCAVPAPLEADPALAEQREDDLERLLESADAVVEREVEVAELRLVPAAAEAEHQPTAADLVELGGHLRGERRVAERDREHERTDLDPAGEAATADRRSSPRGCPPCGRHRGR